MFKFLKYNFLNFFWYYKIRNVDIPDFSKCPNPRDALTTIMLNCVGLTVSDEPIPKYIYLSKIQRKSINDATYFGYKVGLLK